MAKVTRIAHILPEGREGKNLTTSEAKAIATKRAIQISGLSDADIKFVSAETQKHPQRVDWEFEFADSTIEIEDGDARIIVGLAGDEVVDGFKTVSAIFPYLILLNKINDQ